MEISLSLSLTGRLLSSSPATALFSVPGSRGFFYDFSDYSTQFTDTAGTTPVTGVGQSVGLVLDESRGLALGSELVTNGTFDTNLNGWTVGTDPAQVVPIWSSGRVSLTRGTGGIAGFSQELGLVSGRTYRVSFELVSGNVSCGGGIPGFSSVSTLGINTRLIVANGSNIQFWPTNLSSTAVIDNISVRELPGNHATQATAGSRALTQVRPMGVTPRNLLTFSEAFDNAVWTKSVSTVTANTATAPNGATTADTIIPTTTNDFHYVGRAATVVAGTSYVVSFYAKNSGYGFVRYYDGVANNAVFNLSGSGSITDNSGGGATITAVGNGWYLCTKVVVPASTSLNVFIYPQNVVGMVSYAGDGTSGILLWGAQLEVGSTASTYQPTGPALINGEKRNLLVRSEEFDDAGWTKEGVTVSANAVSAPDGTTTAETVSTGVSFGEHRIYRSAGSSAVHSHSIYAKAGTANFVSLSTGNTTYYAVFNLGTGTVSSSVSCTPSIVSVGDGWYRLTVTGSVAMPSFFFVVNIGETAANAVPIVGSTGTDKTVHIWGAQLELGPTPTAYQRVVSTDEWYEPGFTSYRGLRFDGSDDFLQTAAIDFAGAESLGTELVTNGTFAVDANWTKGTGWTIGSGVASFSAGADSSDLVQNIGLPVVGRTYSITLSQTYTSGGSLRIIYGGQFYDVPTATGTYTVLLRATSAPESNLRLRALTGASVFSIDNVSVREVLVPADKMTVVAGVRKLSDAGNGTVLEFTAAAEASNGTIFIRAPSGGLPNYQFLSRGTVETTPSASVFVSPISNVLTCIGDISGDSAIIRANGTQVAQSNTDQGTGTYGNHPVFIGRRGGTTLPFNGVLTFLCVINRTLTAAELAQLEAFANSRTGAY